MRPTRPIRSALLVGLSLLVGPACFDGSVAGQPRACGADDDCVASEVCDTLVGRCRAESAEAPRLVSIRFDPPITRTGQTRLVIEASAPLGDVAVEALDPGLEPGLAGATVTIDGARATLDVAIADETGAAREGYFRVARVALSGSDGLVGIVAVDPSTAVLVDVTAPVVNNVLVRDATPEDASVRVSDIAPDDTFEVRALIGDGAVSEVTCTIGGAVRRLGDGGCEAIAGGAGLYRCVFRVGDGGFIDGENLGTLVATDTAGNQGEAVPLSVPVDLRSPSIVAGTFVTLSRKGRPVTTAEPGVLVELVTAFDEELAAPPVVKLGVVGVLVPLTLVSGEGRVWRFARLLDEADFAAVAGGDDDLTLRLQASFVDRAGHVVSDAVVTAAAPFAAGIPFSFVSASPCQPAPGMGPCVDADGDGHAVIAAGCEVGDDRDDLDATIYPGAPAVRDAELPVRAVFVDDTIGDDANDGGIDAPVATVARAVALSSATRDVIVLGGEGPFVVNAPLRRLTVIGGRASSTFVPVERRPAVLVTEPAGGGIIFDGPRLEGVRTRSLFWRRDTRLVVDVIVDERSESTAEDLVIVGSTLGAFTAFPDGSSGAGRIRVVDSIADAATTEVPGAMVRTRVTDLLAVGVGPFLMTSSGVGAVQIAEATAATFEHTSVHGPLAGIDATGPGVRLSFLFSSLANTAGLETAITLSDPTGSALRAIGSNVFPAFNTFLLVSFGGDFLNVDSLNGNLDPIFNGSDGNTVDDPALSFADVLVPLATTRLTDPLQRSDGGFPLLSPAVVTDLAGACRFNAFPDRIARGAVLPAIP